MLLDLDELADKYNMRPTVTGIVHGGAHLAEEAPDYDRVFGHDIPVLWIEANPEMDAILLDALRPYPNQRLSIALIIDTEGEYRDFNVTNYQGMSSSVLNFGTHPEFSPDTVFVKKLTLVTHTLDQIVWAYDMKSANMLVLDIQGAEGLALKGATGLLPTLDYVMLEVNRDEVYVGCAKVWDLDDTLLAYGLKRVETYWVGDQGWGDALWIR